MRFLNFGNGLRELSTLPPGLQLYTLQNELQKDISTTLQKVAEMGYLLVEVNLGNPEIPATDLKKMSNRFGRGIVSVFVSPFDMDNWQARLNDAQTLNARYITTTLMPDSYKSQARFQEAVESLRVSGVEAKKRGIQLLYHPHDWDYESVKGIRRFDQLLSAVGTDVMLLELDIYWIVKAGLDPYDTQPIYKNLSPLVHIKDIDTHGDFVEIGQGTIDWQRIFQIFQSTGTKYYFIEQDTSPDPLKSIETSLHYVQSRLGMP